MYEKHFGLNKPPFMINHDQEFFKITPSHAESIAKCEYSIRNKTGLAVVYGDVGTGKTTMMWELKKRFDAESDRFIVAVIEQISANTDTSFLKSISKEFGVEPKRSKQEPQIS